MRSFWGMAEEKREDKRKNSEPEARAGKKHKSDRDRSRDRPKGSREHDRSDRDRDKRVSYDQVSYSGDPSDKYDRYAAAEVRDAKPRKERHGRDEKEVERDDRSRRTVETDRDVDYRDREKRKELYDADRERDKAAREREPKGEPRVEPREPRGEPRDRDRDGRDPRDREQRNRDRDPRDRDPPRDREPRDRDPDRRKERPPPEDMDRDRRRDGDPKDKERGRSRDLLREKDRDDRERDYRKDDRADRRRSRSRDKNRDRPRDDGDRFDDRYDRAKDRGQDRNHADRNRTDSFSEDSKMARGTDRDDSFGHEVSLLKDDEEDLEVIRKKRAAILAKIMNKTAANGAANASNAGTPPCPAMEENIFEDVKPYDSDKDEAPKKQEDQPKLADEDPVEDKDEIDTATVFAAKEHGASDGEGEDDMFTTSPLRGRVRVVKDDDEMQGGGMEEDRVDRRLGDTNADNWDDAEGYFRTRPGELIIGRYLVNRDIGNGVYSTVLSAADQQTGREVAIKVVRSNETMTTAGKKEIEILKKLGAEDPEGRRHICKLISHFDYKNHLCMVFVPLEMNLRKLLKTYGRSFTSSCAQRI